MEPMTKKEFKRLHANGELLLLDAVNLSKEEASTRLQRKINEGVFLYDYAMNVTSIGTLTKRETVSYDEANGIVYLESSWDTSPDSVAYEMGSRKMYKTVIYLIR